jgi:hypothetical protein
MSVLSGLAEKIDERCDRVAGMIRSVATFISLIGIGK